ncbi:DUF2797 domain-containing protein [Methermicoccus shengliensis]|uniref:DUF2797 domain-containing protein n=1 Tax=Methermicoccus shengliensis TaxID=660064 RepID=A0A832RWI6_9EURY|nr:DUF2797 domain-containing protein [Methermicoccus shengliensis]KUK05210.1 MAG: Uncharacterized protein XD46_0203 [Euryarchaeota archaeon 55_53]KUK30829.1 MAG: Uncharacterized protein XD62_0088 [Methanosarcinales archeaon 56_1174]MDI3487370.1 hypothetical protein [Methanosarcinales archaeon]MDN5294556.1 hypothetical protein [Methanosarcinales archaeon]HIH69714.1 DUF2797 domain-containing protein [Methermicoccus shengliensis]
MSRALGRVARVDPVQCALVVPPERVRLKGEFELHLGARGCAGSFERGEYVPCTSRQAPYCERCRPFDPCAVCRGVCQKAEMDCTTPHSIYLALFSPDLLKVGVSRTERLKTRLMEQGADIGVEIARCENGQIARAIEHRLSRVVSDRVSTTSKMRGLTKRVNMEVWERAVATFRPIGQPLRLQYFDEQLRSEPLPLRIEPYTTLSGRGIGCKGSLFVFERMGMLHVIDMRDLLGYELLEEPQRTAVQTGLEYFEC